ncbi:MAG: hypothetical protein IPI71_00015 [Methanolinea sp.]|nr:MAG: hypothetical protein IPI71_00015 [Methanolinea sp.]
MCDSVLLAVIASDELGGVSQRHLSGFTPLSRRQFRKHERASALGIPCTSFPSLSSTTRGSGRT